MHNKFDFSKVIYQNYRHAGFIHPLHFLNDVSDLLKDYNKAFYNEWLNSNFDAH